MNQKNNKILNFAYQIEKYGYAITVSAKNGRISTSINSKFTPIGELTNGESLFTFFKEIVDNLNVNQLIVVAKEKNGPIAYKNPKTFILDISETSPHQNQNIAYNSHPVGGGLSGASDPMNQVLTFKIDQQHQQIAELRPYKEKYEDEREKRFDLERELKLIGEKHELEKSKEDYDSKNSISGVLKELKEPLSIALAGLAGNIQSPESVQSLGNPQTDNNKINFLIELFTEIDETALNNLFEINIRLAHLPNVVIPFLTNLKKNTTSIDSQIEDIILKY